MMNFFRIREFPAILLHIFFWLGYYALFGFVWAEDGNYRDSYYLEFILLPARIGAVYTSIYLLIPKFLEKRKYLQFVFFYLISILLFGIIQQFLTYFFYEQNTSVILSELLNLRKILRACVLINSTVLFLSAIRIIQLYHREKERKDPNSKSYIFIKSDKRYHRVNEQMILYAEGLGNYLTYYLEDGQKIIRYGSLKEALSELGKNFIRIHRSYFINKKQVRSFNREGIEMTNGKLLPIGMAYKDKVPVQITEE